MPDEPRDHNAQIRAAERAHDLTDDIGKRLLDGAMRDAQEAIRVALLINSGAAVAVLAFLGAVVSRGTTPYSMIRPIVLCLPWFLIGVVLASLTAAFAYFSNLGYANARFAAAKTWDHPYIDDTSASKRLRCRAVIFNWIAIVTAFGALIAFVLGIVFSTIALVGFTSSFKP